jgi:RNA polymerase sigma-70 factor (ECF subfamily)
MGGPMSGTHTTAAVQRYLDRLRSEPDDEAALPIVRELLAGAANRLQLLCGAMLHRSYPRLARPPLNLETEEMLGAVVERLLKALREARPGNVRQFFALANQHMRWELNDLARRLDERGPDVEVREESVVAPEPSAAGLSADARRILAAIEGLPPEEREAFDLVRIQGLLHAEAAEVLGVSTKTVQRRLNRSLVLLTEALGDLRVERGPGSEA